MPVPAAQRSPHPGPDKRRRADVPLSPTSLEIHGPRDPPAAYAHSPADVVRITGLGKTTVYRALRDGVLKARKFGRRTIILDDDLRAFLETLPQA